VNLTVFNDHGYTGKNPGLDVHLESPDRLTSGLAKAYMDDTLTRVHLVFKNNH